MTEVGEWRARAYWALATVVFPLLNPIALSVVAIGADTEGPSWLLVAACIALVNVLLLWLVASRLWKVGDGRRWRVALGLVAAIALSVPAAYGELLLVLDIACPENGCLS